MIARPEDKETVARIDYDNTKNTNLKTLYNKVSNDMHLYKDDFAEKVTTRCLNTTIKPTEDFGKAYKINQMITISQDDEMDVTEEEELTLLAQDTNHQIRDELEKTVDELEEEVRRK